jgi:hypothetical protein
MVIKVIELGAGKSSSASTSWCPLSAAFSSQAFQSISCFFEIHNIIISLLISNFDFNLAAKHRVVLKI